MLFIFIDVETVTSFRLGDDKGKPSYGDVATDVNSAALTLPAIFDRDTSCSDRPTPVSLCLEHLAVVSFATVMPYSDLPRSLDTFMCLRLRDKHTEEGAAVRGVA